MEEEIWKDVVGYEGFYQVSNLGRVKSLGRKYSPNEEIIRPSYISMGYEIQKLCKDGKSTRISRHRLVATHFIGNPKNKPEVNHIDGDKLNNKANNLEWVTKQENHTHAKDNGLKATGFRHGVSVLDERSVIGILKMLELDFSQRCIAKVFGVSQWVVSSINREETYRDFIESLQNDTSQKH